MLKPSSTAPPGLRVFRKETVVKGRSAEVKCIEIGGQTYVISCGPVSLAILEDEWYEEVHHPEMVIKTLKSNSVVKPDIFTFWQRLPDVTPMYPFHIEWESIAALPLTTYDHWWHRQIKGTTRTRIQRSRRANVEVRRCAYDDAFVRGMVEIFNETPIRQGRRFWHYGKDFETVKRQFSRFLFREDLIGAYHGDELVGFAMLGYAGGYADLLQVISKMKHRNKSIDNALVAKSVEICESKRLPYLAFGSWGDDSLGNFKRHCGFEEVRIPRYVVPLSAKGWLAWKIGVHRGWRELIPPGSKKQLKRLRKSWYRLTLTSPPSA